MREASSIVTHLRELCKSGTKFQLSVLRGGDQSLPAAALSCFGMTAFSCTSEAFHTAVECDIAVHRPARHGCQLESWPQKLTEFY